METFRTFAQSEPTPDAALASVRVNGQDELLDMLREPIVTALVDTVAGNEDALRSVYRPLVTRATALVGFQEGELNNVVDAILDRVRTSIGQQSAALSSVLGTLPADARQLVLTSEPMEASEPRIGDVALSPAERNQGTITHNYETVSPPLANLYPAGGSTQFVPTIPPTIPPTVTAMPGSSVTVPPTSGSTATGSGVTVNVSACCPVPACPTVPPDDAPTPRAGPLLAGAPVDVAPKPIEVFAPPLIWDTADKRLCATADQFVDAFARAGADVRNFIFTGLNMGADLMELVGRLRDINVIGPLFANISGPALVLRNVFQQMGRILMDYSLMFAGPRGDALVGLYFTRGLLLSLNNAKLGFNFVVTADVNLDVVPVQTLKLIDYLINYLHPVDVPHVPDIDQLYLSDVIDDVEAVCMSRMHGRQRSETLRQLKMRRTRLTPDIEVKHWLQQRTPRADLDKLLRTYGMTDAAERDRLVEMNVALPPPSDAIRFSNRDIFDPNKLGRKEMELEFQQQAGLREMFDAIGLEKKTIRTKDGKRLELDLPLMYYMASYEECSPTQVYEMLHRLRPNRVHLYPLARAGGGVDVPEAVSIETVRSLLKEKDYNPIWRNRLAAISFRAIGNTDIKNMYKRGVFGPVQGVRGFDRTDPAKPKPVGAAEIELRERYLDFGYSDNDAAAKAALTATEIDNALSLKGRTKAQNRICAGYKAGGFTYDQALTQLVNVGMDRKAAVEFLGGCDLDMRLTDLRLATNGVKKQWIAGTISEQQARSLLRGYGVSQERIDTNLNTWALYRTQTRRELTAQQIGSYWESGIINLADARARLVNLGYDVTAANMILNHVRMGQLAKSEKERDRLIKAREAEARRLEARSRADAKELKVAEEKRMVRFLALQSEKNFAAWLKAGQITEGEIRAAMTAKGANPEDIERWINTNRPKG